MQRFGLLFRIIIAIALGIIVGIIANDWLIRLFATFNDIFGGFLSFIIPLIILGFIAPGIGYMGKGAGKLLSITALIAYVSTIFAGIVAYTAASNLYPSILSGQSLTMFNDPSGALLEGFLDFEIHPPFEVITALILSFILGIGMAALKNDTLLKVFTDFRSIVELVISKAIIPLLPIHIFGIFANMTHAGQVASILQVFAVVFVMIILLHVLYLIFQYSVAGALSKQNPFRMLKTMLPAYFTALGTQSSAATIPVTLAQSKKLKVKSNIADFTIPLLANIHLSGSTITLLSCATAVLFLQGDSITFGSVFPFLLVLGVTMIAAPGVPGGAVMASIGLLESMLGFGPTMVSLMIALYLAQDSLGTACNVTGDGAITSITDSINNRWNISK
ncbi:sodium:proton antiporter [Oceanobacillus oncorhynchi subsp. incaldanensis]|uniref:Serine/threonine transporter SstT n=1 Tax=Oceanobacillus oncorhynchi TaxID=545501 RepID=A0A0A1MNI8_9BACI|nr:dicarboxylate/amino acid:cation symporter [Oceanobacillus oncorhynchi]UUI38930.1 dicarboxylate/amino acid:cation symporter [Oceanobacillus oncorhynchi]GIO21216.1 sodium:proton antiporter [Oceanobacillus oncorhynchi subsp. incaldanensis]CEI84633.1 Serine/threonine transporter SstT [Oceanobacillus oncorhynchi]